MCEYFGQQIQLYLKMLSSFLLTANHSCILPHACTHSCCRVGKDPPQRSSGTCQNDRISLAISRLQDDGGGTKNRHYKTAEYQDLFKEPYLYLYIRPNLSCTLICDLIAVGSYDTQKIKYINVLTLAHAFFFNSKYTQLVLQYICVKWPLLYFCFCSWSLWMLPSLTVYKSCLCLRSELSAEFSYSCGGLFSNKQ